MQFHNTLCRYMNSPLKEHGSYKEGFGVMSPEYWNTAPLTKGRCFMWFKRLDLSLTHSHTMTPFDATRKQAF